MQYYVYVNNLGNNVYMCNYYYAHKANDRKLSPTLYLIRGTANHFSIIYLTEEWKKFSEREIKNKLVHFLMPFIITYSPRKISSIAAEDV